MPGVAPMQLLDREIKTRGGGDANSFAKRKNTYCYIYFTEPNIWCTFFPWFRFMLALSKQFALFTSGGVGGVILLHKPIPCQIRTRMQLHTLHKHRVSLAKSQFMRFSRIFDRNYCFVLSCAAFSLSLQTFWFAVFVFILKLLPQILQAQNIERECLGFD